MTQTIIICLTIIAIVALICYTSYKIHTFKGNRDILDNIRDKLEWLKSDYFRNNYKLDKINDNVQEIKQFLKEITDETI